MQAYHLQSDKPVSDKLICKLIDMQAFLDMQDFTYMEQLIPVSLKFDFFR